MISKLNGSLTLFEETWKKYIVVVVNYALSHLFQSKDLRHALRDLTEDDIATLKDSKWQ